MAPACWWNAHVWAVSVSLWVCYQEMWNPFQLERQRQVARGSVLCSHLRPTAAPTGAVGFVLEAHESTQAPLSLLDLAETASAPAPGRTQTFGGEAFRILLTMGLALGRQGNSQLEQHRQVTVESAVCAFSPQQPTATVQLNGTHRVHVFCHIPGVWMCQYAAYDGSWSSANWQLTSKFRCKSSHSLHEHLCLPWSIIWHFDIQPKYMLFSDSLDVP